MENTTRLVRDDDYEQMGVSYQCIQIATLDAAMLEHGITDPAVRQQVVESFVFNMGNFHDQGWFEASAKANPIYPVLCFSTRFIHSNTPVDKLGTIYMPSEMFAYHEYAIGTVGSFYEGDPAAHVETGSFSEIDEDTADAGEP